uniref:Uncharacterized protein n=1 Tax=Romanomermis culicivorax TaxID=13658 RepID=A0A915HSQ4_ROMCU
MLDDFRSDFGRNFFNVRQRRVDASFLEHGRSDHFCQGLGKNANFRGYISNVQKFTVLTSLAKRKSSSPTWWTPLKMTAKETPGKIRIITLEVASYVRKFVSLFGRAFGLRCWIRQGENDWSIVKFGHIFDDFFVEQKRVFRWMQKSYRTTYSKLTLTIKPRESTIQTRLAASSKLIPASFCMAIQIKEAIPMDAYEKIA